MRTQSEILQDIVRQYQAANQPWPATTRDMAQWAISNRLWAPKPSAIIDQCADQLSRAMREEYITDAQGRRVRAKHAATVTKCGVQFVLWEDVRTAPHQHMQMAFQQRRHQIVGDCRQLKMDVDRYNDNRQPEQPIQMIFDFTYDLEELALAA
ncbi:MAG: hypothetical protein KF778_18830 [Rhodocyclaceae bacterium]|nr:hypothetical protein [Rhodocyclaceae bacterium]